jgi:hypothetical protein
LARAQLRTRLLTSLAAALLLTAVCSPTQNNIPVQETKPGHETVGGVSNGVPDGSVLDGSVAVPDGSTEPPAACYLCCGAAGSGCPADLTPTQVTTETGSVCLCETNAGGTGCDLCDPSNPANGGCDAGVCTAVSVPSGYFYLCTPAGETPATGCGADAG